METHHSLKSIGSFKEGDGTVPRWRGGLDRAGSDSGADWHPRSTVGIWHSYSHPTGESAGRRSSWDSQQPRGTSLQTWQPWGGQGRRRDSVHHELHRMRSAQTVCFKCGLCLLCHRNTFLHHWSGPELKENMMSITTMPFLWPHPTIWPVCTRRCVNSTKQRNCTKTSWESIQTMWTVSVKTLVKLSTRRETVIVWWISFIFFGPQVICVLEQWLVTKGISTKLLIGSKKPFRLIRYCVIYKSTFNCTFCCCLICDIPLGSGSPGCLVPDRQPSLGQTGMGARSKEIRTYFETAIHTEWHVLHVSFG